MAILSSPSFDATDVKTEELRFGQIKAAPSVFNELPATEELDVDGQHGNDTMARFNIDDLGYSCPLDQDDWGYDIVSLTGETETGQKFGGFDYIDYSDCSGAGDCHNYENQN